MKSYLNIFLFMGLSSNGLPAETIGANFYNENSVKSGRLKSLVVFAHFPEDGALVDKFPPSFAKDLFRSELSGSLTHFYSEMSQGQFTLDGEVLPRRISVSNPRDSYTEPVGSYRGFVKEIIDVLDRDIDLALYDNDGPDGQPNSGDDDGYLDFLFIVTHSVPEGFILGSATGVARLGLKNDYRSNDSSAEGGNIRIRADDSDLGVGGSIQRGKNFEESVGSMAHEFGHYLGLPDLYNTSGLLEDLEPQQESAGIGYWGIMGHGNRGWNETDGPNPFCVWSLAQLGWLGQSNERLIVIDGDQKGVEIGDVRDGGHVYMLRIPGSTSYYLVAHRRRANSYYERNLPAEGVLIWLVNPDVSDNNNEEKPLVRLVSADGTYSDAGYPIGRELKPFTGKDNLDFWSKDVSYRDLHAGNLGDSTDVWDGIRFRDFWPASNPGAPGGISILNMETQGDRIRADLSTVDEHRAGPIFRDQIWDGNISLVGDIWIQNDVQLELQEGTVVQVGRDMVGMGRDPKRIEINVYGHLVVNKNGEQPVLFTSTSINPTPGDWTGILFSKQGSGFVRRTEIEYAQNGLASERQAGFVEMGEPSERLMELREVSVRLSSGDGIRLSENIEPVLFSDIEIYDNEGYGVNLTGSGLVDIENGLISRNQYGGIKREGGFIKLSNTQLVDNGGDSGANLTLGRQAYGRIEDNKISGGIGIECVETIMGGLQNNQLVLRRNVFIKNTLGLNSFNSLLNISRNEWIDCDLAMRFAGVVSPERLDLNVILGDGLFVINESDVEVNATNNWWGSGNATEISKRMQGLVNWDPFLNFDPRLPLEFSLEQPYPNPVFSEVTIEYQIGINDPIIEGYTRIELDVRNALGLLVRRLVDDVALPGIYVANWDGCDSVGRNAASGFYYVELKIGPIRQYRKLLVIR